MDNKGVISLLGCGWLGFPLAKSLVSAGFNVSATTTTSSKREVLESAGIDSFLVHFSGTEQTVDLKKLFNAETLIVTIPPGRRDPNGFGNYKRMVQHVCDELPGSKVSKLILISSTSVYPDINDLVDEHSQIRPETESGVLMAESEILFAKQNVNMISLRLAGLIGPGRLPGKFFAGKKNVPNGLAPVNLIHLNDAVGIVNKLISENNAQGIYNGCAPVHPTKEEFYTLAAELEGLDRPQFISEKRKWKVISSVRVAEELKYQFRIPSPMDWINSMETL